MYFYAGCKNVDQMIKNLDSKQQFKFVLGVFALFTLLELLNLFTGRFFNQFGNIPRYVPGLTGVLLGPFIHGSLQHFLSNIVPLCIFSFLLLQYGLARYLLVSIWIIVITGILVWLFGRAASHIGASGLIFGVLPSFSYISWESHLFGFLSGLVAAKLWAKIK